MTTILGTIRLLRTTAAAIAAEVLEEGRIAYLTDEETMVSGDGTNVGADLPRVGGLTLAGDLDLDGNSLTDGLNNIVTAGAGGTSAVVLGLGSATGVTSLAFAGTASGDKSAAIGYLTLAAAESSLATGGSSETRLKGSHAHAAFSYGAFSNGNSQGITVLLGRKTTDATPAALSLDSGSPGADDYFAVPAGFVISGLVQILGVKSDGSQAAHYARQFTIKNVGGTTALVGAVQVVGVDVEDDGDWDVAITADDTNDAVAITVTGKAATTIRWLARFTGVELAYGT